MAGGAVTEATLVELVKTMAELTAYGRETVVELRRIREAFERVPDGDDDQATEAPANGSDGEVQKPNGLMGGAMAKLEERLLKKFGSLDDIAVEGLFKRLDL